MIVAYSIWLAIIAIVGLLAFGAGWAVKQPRIESKVEDTSAGGRARLALATILAAVTICSLYYRWLVSARLEQTAALFIGIPGLLAVIVVLFARPRTATGLILKATAVALLASGIFLGEGFICILMASPLFFAVAVIIGGICDLIRSRRSQPTVMGLLVLAVLPMSLEGTSPQLSFRRDQVVIAEALVNAAPADVRSALAATPQFTSPLPTFLRLRFPRPVETSGQGLAIGDRRVIHFAGGEGKPGDLVAEVAATSDHSVNFRFVYDSSKIAHWLAWQSADVEWSRDVSGKTRVRWTLRYKRLLDPAWYFGPWERYAVGLAGDYLIQNVTTPH